MKLKSIPFLTAFLAFFLINPLHPNEPTGLVASPSTFDFGWSPDDVKIFADFKITNQGFAPVQLGDIQPTCGCTAANFSPTTLNEKENSEFQLSFNTRGYKNRSFFKPATIKNEKGDPVLTVKVKGRVENKGNVFKPKGNGIASFSSEEGSTKKTVQLINSSSETLTVSVVQKPSDWVSFKLASNEISPNGTLNLILSPNQSFEENRESSLTLEAKGKKALDRVTISVRKGDFDSASRFSAPPTKKN